ncbi:MAG TPA: peptide ABC transporter substrate-binding protein, partial [Candidatus Baltobacteraceae bacterium]
MKVVATALVLALVLPACSQQGPGHGVGGRHNSWTVPHQLTYTTAEDISGLNPHLYSQLVVGLLSQLTMAYLIRWNKDNLPYPELATVVPTKANGGVSADGLTITYHLREGVKWSDGAPFDADDVLFSIKTVLNPANNEIGRVGWNLIASATAPNKYTVVLHMSRPYSPFVETFFSTAGANPCILPKHLLAKYPNINNVPYNALPIGIGPFKYERWDRATQVVLVPNPTYWRGVPKLQRIVFKIIPNRDTAVAELESHELDMWWPIGGAYYPQVKRIPGYTVSRKPGYIYNHLDFNIQRPRVSDPAVREAIRLATNRIEIRDKIGRGLGIVQDEPAPATAPYYDPSIGTTAFDIAAANVLLDKAGWKSGADGIRAKNGVKLDLDVASTTGTPDVDNQIALIQGWWKKIGIGIVVKRYPAPMMFMPAASGGVTYGNSWDVIFFAWGSDPLGDFSSIYSCHVLPPAGQNDLRWCNPKAQAAMDALYTHFSQAQRNKDASVVMKELVKDVPTIVFSVREDVWA